ncbi:DUF4157 domain-containing protein [Alkalinema pantanalense CENA528]|uniref:eCIS core domain-containing protein n=1 Tax=Alkalinema pantanalense TaxID=1620705 RepID=UPI003D6EACB4
MTQKTQTTTKLTPQPTLNVDQSGLLQRKCECGNAAGLTGECEDCQRRKLTGDRRKDSDTVTAPVLHNWIQPKLTIGAPNDPYEQEADRVADRVMRMPAPDAAARGPWVRSNLPFVAHPFPLQKQELKEEDEDKKQGKIQAKEASGQAPEVTSELEERLRASQGKGQPLPEETRSFMEPRFGADFSQVRVHTDGEAAQMNRAINAQAFTHRQDIYFAASKYHPASKAGQQLIAHELTHVMQQTGKFQAQLSFVGDDRNSLVPLMNPVSWSSIQRQDAPQSVTADQLIDEHTNWIGNLNEEELGKDLADRLPSQSLLASEVLNKLSSSDRDDVAYEITTAASEKLVTIPAWLRMRFVQEMIDGVVTDEEEGAIAQIWISFEPNISVIAEENRDFWKKSLWESDQLSEYLQPQKYAFKWDVLDLARTYIAENRKALLTEAERYGIDLEATGKTIAETPGYLEAVRSVAPNILQLKNILDQLRQIYVGYNTEYEIETGTPYQVAAKFNPEAQPERPPEGNESPPWPTWEEAKNQYDRVDAIISSFASLYPSIYILIQQNKLEALVQAGDATKAQATVAEVMQITREKLDESDEKIRTEDIEYYDLMLIQSQLFNGSPKDIFIPRYPWEQPFYQDIAKDDIKGHEARAFWADLGLSLVAAAALIAAPFTGGASAVFLIGFGVGIGATQAGMSWEKYLDLSTLADAEVKEDLALIAEGQVSAQLLDAIIQTVSVFLDVYGAGKVGTTGAKVGARSALKVAERELMEQIAEEASKKAGREAAKEIGMTAAGAGVAIGLHELANDEPDYQIGGSATRHQIDLGPDTPETTPTTVSPMLIQRAGGGSPGGVTTPPKQPIILTGGEFEVYVEKALLKGSDGLPKMDFVIPGQYRGGSGWGVDRIGIVYDNTTGKINVYHFEMKFVSEGSPHVPELGSRAAGTQTGKGWTANAIDGFLNSQHPNARAGRERLRRVLKKLNLESDIAGMRKFLQSKLVDAPVIIVTPDWAKLSKLYKQVAALIRHGREVSILKVFKK